MFKRVEKKDIQLIEEYIGTDYDKCLYLYLDFIKGESLWQRKYISCLNIRVTELY